MSQSLFFILSFLSHPGSANATLEEKKYTPLCIYMHTFPTTTIKKKL